MGHFQIANAQLHFNINTGKKAMIYNNLGIVLTKLHEPTEADYQDDEAAAPAQEKDSNPQLFGSSLQKKKPKNANRNKALE